MEIIVLDDASTDNSVKVVESIAREHPLIRLHRNERNLGVVSGMNRGLELACGDYVYFGAADDEVQPGFFEKSLLLLAQHPRAGLSCTVGDWREASTGLNWHVGVGMCEQPSYLPPTTLVELGKRGKLFLAGHTAIFKRSTLLNAGKFIPDLKWHCDWFALYVIAFRHGLCFVPEPLGIANIHPASYYQNSRARKLAQWQVLHHMIELIEGNDFRDIAELFRESGILAIFELPILKLLISDVRYRRFITPVFLRKNLGRILQLQFKKITPSFLGNWYFRSAGYRARAARSGAGKS
jgi:glycosyltransferase involved in cell wall biosynthesis